MLIGSRTGPLLDEPIRKGSSTSVIICLRRKKELQWRCNCAPVVEGSEKVALVDTCHISRDISRVSPPLIYVYLSFRRYSPSDKLVFLVQIIFVWIAFQCVFFWTVSQICQLWEGSYTLLKEHRLLTKHKLHTSLKDVSGFCSYEEQANEQNSCPVRHWTLVGYSWLTGGNSALSYSVPWHDIPFTVTRVHGDATLISIPIDKCK